MPRAGPAVPRFVGAVPVVLAGALAFIAGPAEALQDEGPPVEELYSTSCAPCHGPTGRGGMGPPLVDDPLSPADRLEAITNGARGMPAFSLTLTRDQIERLAQHIEVLSGQQVYLDNCAPCHGSAGEGGVAPPLQIEEMSLEARLQIIAEGTPEMPAFGPILSASEISAVNAFLDDLDEVDLGPSVYAELCAPCHGSGGEGGVGPSLVESTLRGSRLTGVISRGRGSMPGFGATMTAAGFEAIATYVESLQSPAAGAGDGVGADLFAEHCSSCHGPEGEGGIGPAITALDSSREEAIVVVGDGRGAMPGFVGTLTDDEIEAVVDHLGEWGGPGGAVAEAHEAGEALYAAECSACHGPSGEGGIGPALAAMTLTADEIATVVTDGQGAMPGFEDSLSPSEVAIVAAYLTGDEVGGEISGSTAAEIGEQPDEEGHGSGLLARGRDLYSTTCQGCHQSGGVGVEGTFPPLIGNPRTDDSAYLTDVILNGLEQPIEVGGVAYDGAMPGFPTLSNEDVEAVVAFIQAGLVVPGDGSDSGAAALPLAGTTLPTFAGMAAVAAWLLVAGATLFVVGPKLTGAFDRAPWLRVALIVLGLVVATTWYLQSSTVANLPDAAREVVVFELWIAGVALAIWALWYTYRDRRT